MTEAGDGLVSAGLDGQLQLWSRSDEVTSLGTTARSAQRWQRTLTQPVDGGEINGMALLGSVLACGCQDGSVCVLRSFCEPAVHLNPSMSLPWHVYASSTHPP